MVSLECVIYFFKLKMVGVCLAHGKLVSVIVCVDGIQVGLVSYLHEKTQIYMSFSKVECRCH